MTDISPHDLASVTKSVTSTLIGIAEHQGFLDPDAPLLSFFSERDPANPDPRKDRMTLRHLAEVERRISGRTYAVEANRLGFVALRVTRDTPALFHYEGSDSSSLGTLDPMGAFLGIPDTGDPQEQFGDGVVLNGHASALRDRRVPLQHDK